MTWVSVNKNHYKIKKNNWNTLGIGLPVYTNEHSIMQTENPFCWVFGRRYQMIAYFSFHIVVVTVEFLWEGVKCWRTTPYFGQRVHRLYHRPSPHPGGCSSTLWEPAWGKLLKYTNKGTTGLGCGRGGLKQFIHAIEFRLGTMGNRNWFSKPLAHE